MNETTKPDGIKKHFILFFATGTYTGYSPFASGTVGSLWGIPVAYGISLLTMPLGALAVALTVAISIFFASKASNILGGGDPGAVVCDEIAGFALAAFLVPFTATNIILVFIFFRIFDILKPYPAGYLDKSVSGGTGIVLDDIAAGVYANIATQLIIRYAI